MNKVFALFILLIIIVVGLFTFVGSSSNVGYAALYVNDDFHIQFQYPDDWNVTQKDVKTIYGIEQDISRLFEIKSPEIYEWKSWQDYNRSDTATITVVLYHDISDLKQFTNIVKKIMITTESNIDEIKYDGKLIDNGNTTSVMILGNKDGVGTKYLTKVFLFHEGNNGYLVGYTAPSKLATEEHKEILYLISDDILKSLKMSNIQQ